MGSVGRPAQAGWPGARRRLAYGDRQGRTMVRAAPSDDAPGMTMKPDMTQRDLVRLAVLMCGDRPGEKYRRPGKGAHNSSDPDPTRGFDR